MSTLVANPSRRGEYKGWCPSTCFGTFDPQNCREQNGVYTYDRRGSKTYISNSFPEFHLEDGFSEEDMQWLCDIRETKTQMVARAQSVFDMIFNEEPPVTCEHALHIHHSRAHGTTCRKDPCLTIHGGLINAFLSVLGCPRRSLPTGGRYF